jgi:hypothetical protein
MKSSSTLIWFTSNVNVAVSEEHGPNAITVTVSPALFALKVTVPEVSFEDVPLENST